MTCAHILCRLRGGGACTEAERIPPLSPATRSLVEHAGLEQLPAPIPLDPVRPPPGARASMLTPAQVLEIQAAARAHLARASLYDFVRLSWHAIEPGTELDDAWYLRAICDHVQGQLEDWSRARGGKVFSQRAQNLLINIPPRMLKSRIVNVCASAWAWLHWPDMSIMSLSSNPRVSENCARDVLNLIRGDWYQATFAPAWKITGDALSNLVNSAGGTRAARGLDSKITGEGADWQIIDDPHDADEVYSEAKRIAVTDGYTAAVYNRVRDQRCSIRTAIMQRLHEADFSGTCAAAWPCLRLPMEFEPDRPCTTPFGFCDPRTEEGEILHPARFSREFLEAEKVRLGSYGYAGQFQQRPAPEGGGMIKLAWLQPYDEVPTCESVTLSVDAAFKKTKKGSRVAILVIGRKGSLRFVLDNSTMPRDFKETVAAIKDMRQRWPQVTKVLIEDKANGPAIINELRSIWSDVVEAEPGSDSKEARCHSVLPQLEARSVHVPRHAPWLEDFKHEVGTFPLGAHDDQVDALVQALIDMKFSNDAARAAMLNLA